MKHPIETFLILTLLFTAGSCAPKRAEEAAPPAGRERLEAAAPALPDGKPSAGLGLRFEAPEKMDPREGPVSLKLAISGARGESVRVRLLVDEGVSLAAEEAVPPTVALDERGRGLLKIPVLVEAVRGGLLVAQVTTADGRMQEVRWVYPGEATERRPEIEVMDDGSAVRLSPSR